MALNEWSHSVGLLPLHLRREPCGIATSGHARSYGDEYDSISKPIATPDEGSSRPERYVHRLVLANDSEISMGSLACARTKGATVSVLLSLH